MKYVVLICLFTVSCEPIFNSKYTIDQTGPWLYQMGNATRGPGNDTSQDDRCLSMVVDSFGHIYCGGSTTSNLGESFNGTINAFVMKLNHRKEILWLKHFGDETILPNGGTAGFESCQTIALSPDERHIYCAGSTSGSFGEIPGGGQDAFVLKMDLNGNLKWIRQIGEQAENIGYNADDDETCLSLVIDPDENIFCFGTTTGDLVEANTGGTDIFVMKLSPAGEIRWIKQIGGTTSVPGGDTSGNDICTSATRDSAGYLYCAGSTSSNMGENHAGGSDILLIKMTSEAEIVWVKQIGQATTVPGNNKAQTDQCSSLLLDNSSNIYCGGFTNGSIGEANAGSSDALIIKFNSIGNIVWTQQLGLTSFPARIVFPFTSQASMQDRCASITFDKDGGIICMGSTFGDLGEATTSTAEQDVFIYKVNSVGDLQWIKQLGLDTFLGGETNQNDSCSSLVWHAEHLFCAGFTFGDLVEVNGGQIGTSDILLLKFRSDGTLGL